MAVKEKAVKVIKEKAVKVVKEKVIKEKAVKIVKIKKDLKKIEFSLKDLYYGFRTKFDADKSERLAINKISQENDLPIAEIRKMWKAMRKIEED